MDYQTFEPNKDLVPLIKCYWTLESPSEKTPKKQVIVPDGCMEMIFHYGDLYKQYVNSDIAITQPRCFVFGQITKPLEIEPTGITGIFSVRFHPNGFLPFATVPLKEMENKPMPLFVFFGSEAEEIEENILKAKSSEERIKLIETFLTKQLESKKAIDRIVKSTVRTILTANGQLSVRELSKKTNISPRQLERKFSLAIGLSPKQLSKTIRLQATLTMLLSKNFTSLTALAYENEYYDQAHFIKDFKDLTGFTPKEFYGENLKMSALFYSED